MDEERLKRYKEKIAYITSNLENLPEPNTETNKKAIFYDLHTCIEACMSLLSMLTKDMGMGVLDDVANVHRIIEKRELNPKLGEQLLKANGMRNIIVHRYNSFDEKIVLGSMKNVKALLFKWMEIIEGILDDII